MNYTHDNAEWQTSLTTGETVKVTGNTHDQGCTGRVIEVADGWVVLLLPDGRVRRFCPHELARPSGEPHIELVSGKPRTVNRPLKPKAVNWRGEPLKGMVA